MGSLIDLDWYHDRVMHQTCLVYGVLDLGQLDPVPMDLDLIVLATQTFDFSAGKPSSQIAGAIHTFHCQALAVRAL
jgi:hypothetical protein